MTKPKILVSRRWPQAVEDVMKQKYDVTFNISDEPLSTTAFKEALSVYDAILPTVTVIGVGMGFLLSAAVFTEIVFSRPGLGKLVIDSITTRNYPVVMGSVLFSTLIFVASTTLADIINALLDPRTRKGS